MSDQIELSMSLPLDRDGFLRRECPTCERQLKFVVTDADGEEESQEVDPAGLFCPYCAIPSPPSAWHTAEQLHYAEIILAREGMGPIFDRAEAAGFRVTRNAPEEPTPLTEDDDMRRVEFACHPGEPIKVLDDWTGAVHCIVCGTPAAT
jgi:hypothetical protein